MPTPSPTVGALDAVGGSTTWMIECVGDIMTEVISHPILLISVGIFVVGAAIALFKRLV